MSSKPLCLGATAAMMGRSYLYGLGAAGEQGVDKALGFILDEIDRTMKLIGIDAVADLGPDSIRHKGPAS